MGIEPKFLTFDELLQKKLFKISDYQRAYSWTSRERKELFNDISKLYITENYSDGYRNHFMATIVCCTKKKVYLETDEYVDFDIVDGQQRITTLIILLKAISKKLKETDPIKYKKTLRSINELLVKDEDNKLILIQTNHESSIHLREYLLNGTVPDRTKIKTHATKNLVNAFKDCEKYIVDWMSLDRTVLDLLKLVKNRLNFILHVIEDEATVYTVFEVLNSRGLDVDWLDKCKSVIMGIAFEKLNKENKNFNQTIEYLHKYWSLIYKEIGIANITGSEIVRFTATLYNPDKLSKVMKVDDAIDFIKSQCINNPQDTVEFSKKILDVTTVLRSIEDNKRLKSISRIIHTRLLYVAIKLSQRFNEEQKDHLLYMWEQITFKIFGLAHKDSRSQVGAFVRLAHKAMGINNNDIYVKDYYELREMEESFNELDQYIPMKTIITTVSDADSYNNWEKELIYLFYRYERYLSKKNNYNFQEDIWDIIWQSPTNDSIEHIYPQNPEPHWKGIITKRKDYHRNRLGNLIILPIKMNKRASNLDFHKKKSIYIESSMKSVSEIQYYSKWDHKTIDQRTAIFIEWISNEWNINYKYL